MLSTLNATEEEYVSAEKFNSRLNVLLEHESEEDLKARKILTSPFDPIDLQNHTMASRYTMIKNSSILHYKENTSVSVL